MPLADFHFRYAKLAPAACNGALCSLQMARARLDEMIAHEQRSDLTRAVVEQLSVLADFLSGLATRSGSEFIDPGATGGDVG